MKRLVILVAIVAALLGIFLLRRSEAPLSEAERISGFTKSMSGVTLVGYSTRTDRAGLSGEERYYIDSVTHLTGDNWLFRTRLNYKGSDIPVPIPLTVAWAGDTPVITLTDLAIPKLGTFTARVVLYREQYAGTWSGDHGGGQLFGKIVRAAPQADKGPA